MFIAGEQSCRSCSKDDDKPLSFMEFRGKHYKLKKASFSYIIKYSDSLTKFGASFSSLTKTDQQFYFDDLISGTIRPYPDEFIAFDFEIFSSHSEYIDKGVYDYGFGEEYGPEFTLETFLPGLCYAPRKETQNASRDLYGIKDGKITVSKTGNPYLFEFEFTLDNGEMIQGQYYGKIEHRNSWFE